jgi:hypothetical protein
MLQETAYGHRQGYLERIRERDYISEFPKHSPAMTSPAAIPDLRENRKSPRKTSQSGLSLSKMLLKSKAQDDGFAKWRE